MRVYNVYRNSNMAAYVEWRHRHPTFLPTIFIKQVRIFCPVCIRK